MDIKDIVILVLGFSVVLLVGYLLGSRRAPPRNELQYEQKDKQGKIHQNSRDHIDARPKKNPYEKLISVYRDQCRRAGKIYGQHAQNVTLSPFNEGYEKIDNAYKKYNEKKSSSPREALLELFSASYEAANFGNVRIALESEMENCAEMILSGYDETIGEIFSGQSFEQESSRYALGADLRASQKAKISGILNSNCTQILGDIREIEQRRVWLQSNLATFIQDTKGEFDWGDAAKHFGAGALAAAHPLIGIPALISSFKGSSDKERAKEARVDKYTQVFGEFEDVLLSTRGRINKSGESAKAYMETKFLEIHDQAVVAILTDLSSKGYSLEHCFKFCEKAEVELRAAEKRVFG